MKTHLKTIALLFFILSFQILKAQNKTAGPENKNGGPGQASMIGKIVDAQSGSPVEFAAVALWQNEKVIDGALTDQSGKFEFQNLRMGNYKIVISYVGFKPFTYDNIQITSNQEFKKLNEIKLNSETTQLNEVTVTGQATLVEDKIDRLVYNADKDISNRGVSAEEVLRKVPMLTVDLDGNVSIRGNQNIKVLINNKPSTIFATNVGDAIKQIPSDQIKSVEVITSPGAKYDSEGTGGIINITLKKNTLAGVNGMASAGVGYRGSNASLNLNIRDNKWGISLNGDGRYSYNIKRTSENTRESFVNGIGASLIQNQTSKGYFAHGGFRGTFDYNFDPNTSFTVSYSGRIRQNGGKGDLTTQNFNSQHNLVSDYSKFIDQNNKGNSYDLDFNFLKKYSNPIQEFSVLAQISNQISHDDFNSTVSSVPIEKSLNDGKDREITFQVDYVQPLKNNSKFEIGAKDILRKAVSNGNFFNINNGVPTYNEIRSNYLDYDQNVISGYGSFTFELPKKWGVQAGARYERTTINATFKDEASSTDIPDYSNVLPSFSIIKKTEKAGSFRLSWTQRIQRPSIRYLNPYVNQSNLSNVSYGNPTLKPELNNQFELNYNTFWKSNTLNISVYHRQTGNGITSIKNVILLDSIYVTETTFDNVGKSRGDGVNVSLNFMPSKSFRIGGDVSADYNYLSNNTISNSGWNFSGRMNASWLLPKDYSISAFLFARSQSIQLQGRQGAFTFNGISFKKDLWDKKGSIGLTIEVPFSKTINVKSKYASYTDAQNYFTQDNIDRIYRRSIKVDFQYKFGKLDQKSLFKKRKSINNDDKKGGDGGGGEI